MEQARRDFLKRAGIGATALAAPDLAAEPGKEAVTDLDFSWDTVPRFLYISGNKQFTREELDYIARTSYWVTFAINFAKDDFATYDDAVEHTATELKKRNPRIKVLYYWNTTRRIGQYGRVNEEFDLHPEWDVSQGKLGRLRNGNPIRMVQKQTTPEIDLSHPGARQWWLNNAFNALKKPYIDGLWVDATARIYNKGVKAKLKKAGLWEQTEMGLHLMFEELAEHYRDNNGLLIGNFLREHDDYPYDKLWQYFDGSFVENHYNLIGEAISDSEYIKKVSNVISRIQDAARVGKVIGFYAGGIWDPTYDPKQYSFEERKQKLAKHLEYNLALYLIVAEKHVYVEYNDGFRADYHVWKAEFPEYYFKLGPPNGRAKKRGNVYTREFAHASVVLDIKKRKADITWREESEN